MSAIFQGFGGSLSDGRCGRPTSASPISPSRSASSRSGASSTTSRTTRCAPTCCSSSPTWRAAPSTVKLGLDGAGAALARPGAGRRADRDARPHVQRPADPRTRPGHRQGRVRRVPRRDGVRPPAVQGGGRGHPRRARDRRHGVPRRVRRSAAGGAPPRAARRRSRAGPTRRPSRPSRRRSWPGSVPVS